MVSRISARFRKGAWSLLGRRADIPGAISTGFTNSFFGSVLALPSFNAQFNIVGLSIQAQNDLASNLAVCYQAGCLGACFIAYPFAEIMGRRKAMGLFGLIFLLGSCLMLIKSLPAFYAGRFLTGFGLGPITAIGPLCTLSNHFILRCAYSHRRFLNRPCRNIATSAPRTFHWFHGYFLSGWSDHRLLDAVRDLNTYGQQEGYPMAYSRSAANPSGNDFHRRTSFRTGNTSLLVQ